MQAIKTERTPVPRNPTYRFISIVIILSLLSVIGLYINNAIKAFHATNLPNGTNMISQSALEEKYGLRVNLVALTAAGGLVDVRLKIVDGDKSKLLLADKQNFPALRTEQGIILSAPEETKSQKIEFISGGNLFIIYPNSGNAIQHDTPVTLVFGDITVEPIQTK